MFGSTDVAPVVLPKRSDNIRRQLMVKLSRLKLIRERKALTQEELAERTRDLANRKKGELGVSRVTIARLEAGVDEPRPSTTRKLAQALGVEPEELMEPLA